CLNLACCSESGEEHLEVVKYLIEPCKMDPHITNNDNKNCLAIACRYFCKKIIMYLIEDCKMCIYNIRTRDICTAAINFLAKSNYLYFMDFSLNPAYFSSHIIKELLLKESNLTYEETNSLVNFIKDNKLVGN